MLLHADMIVHPDFLQRTLGHFYTQAEDGKWVLKAKTAFLQTPQVSNNLVTLKSSGWLAHLIARSFPTSEQILALPATSEDMGKLSAMNRTWASSLL